jgi:hypothetical protein
MLKLIHGLFLLRCSSGPRRSAAQDLSCQASAFAPQCFKEIERRQIAIACPLLGQRDDFSHARRYQNAFPDAVVAGAHRSANLGVNLADIGTLLVQRGDDGWIVFL